MPYSNRAKKLCVLAALLAALPACWAIGTAYETAAAKERPNIPSTEEELRKDFSYLSVTQWERGTEMTAPVEVDLSQAGDGYEITAGGEFRLTGELRGTLVIDAEDQNVHLFLDNVTVTSKSGPAIYCRSANKLVITLMPGTENWISDLGSYRADGEAEACIYSECGLTFNGTGGLIVNGYYKDAIRSRDVVKILDGVYTVKCKRTGVHGNDGILVTGGKFMISSEKYGLKTSNLGAEGRGNMIISGGEFSIIAGRYAFVTAKADLLICDCVVSESSVVDTYDVGGTARVQEGCVQ